MTPFEKAAHHYRVNFPREILIFERLLDDVGKNRGGYIYSDSRIFVAATETRSDLPLSEIEDPAIEVKPGTANVWFIHLFAGDFSDVIAYSPYPLPFVAFSRMNRGVKFYGWNSLVDSLSKRGKLSERSRYQLASHQTYGP